MRILIVEDHALVRAGIRMLAENTKLFDDFVECASLTAGVAAARKDEFALVMLDLHLPDAAGMDAVVHMRQAVGHVPILVVAGSHDKATIDGSFANGANGFLPKNSTPAALQSAIEAVLRGEYYVPPHVIPSLSGGAASGGGAAATDTDDTVKLTHRQRDVLILMARGFANKEIAHELHMSPSTVRVHVTAILRALDVENRTQAATHPTTRQLLGVRD